MTAPDHTPEQFTSLLHARGHPYMTPLSGTAEVVPVVNRGDPRGFV